MNMVAHLYLDVDHGFLPLTRNQRLSEANRVSTSATFESSATVCDKKPIKNLTTMMKSQDDEDQTLLEWFNGLCGGTYIEMGALDGVRFSNSYVFNKGLDWKGLLIELSPVSFTALQKNRPNELATINAAVCDERRMLHYVDTLQAVNGVWEFAADNFKKKWWSGITINQTTPVECVPLRDIIDKHAGNLSYFDFFSLDVEGAEFEVLQSLDYSKIAFGIIVVEANWSNRRKNIAVRTFIESHGYVFLFELKRNYWLANKDFHSIYKGKLH
jgi:FkbM family methyltransferase